MEFFSSKIGIFHFFAQFVKVNVCVNFKKHDWRGRFSKNMMIHIIYLEKDKWHQING